MFATIWIPRFRLQAAMRWRELPPTVALIDSSETRSLVLEVTPEAEAMGVYAGVTPAQALGRCPELTILARGNDQEQTAASLLLETAFALSPKIEKTTSDAVTIDLTTAPRGACWQRFGEEALQRLQAVGITARIGFAGHPDHAFLAARCGETINVVYNGAAFVGALPIGALEPDPKTAAILHDWGIRKVGQLLRLPKADTIARLGAVIEGLWDRASAKRHRVLRLAQPTESFLESYDFEYPVETSEPLLFLLRRFLGSLGDRVRESYRVIGRMRLALVLDGSRYERDFSVPAPTTDVETLYRILDSHLETLRLEVIAARTLGRQLDLFAAGIRDPNGFGETLARLQAVNGDDAVGTPAAFNSHRPDAFKIQEFSDESAESGAEPPAFGIPLRRFRPPIIAHVRSDHGEPAWLHVPSLAGPITHVAGPYRLCGDWWAQDAWAIDEWDAEIEGHGLVRLGRRGDVWWLEGTYNVCLVR